MLLIHRVLLGNIEKIHNGFPMKTMLGKLTDPPRVEIRRSEESQWQVFVLVTSGSHLTFRIVDSEHRQSVYCGTYWPTKIAIPCSCASAWPLIEAFNKSLQHLSSHRKSVCSEGQPRRLISCTQPNLAWTQLLPLQVASPGATPTTWPCSSLHLWAISSLGRMIRNDSCNHRGYSCHVVPSERPSAPEADRRKMKQNFRKHTEKHPYPIRIGWVNMPCGALWILVDPCGLWIDMNLGGAMSCCDLNL